MPPRDNGSPPDGGYRHGEKDRALTTGLGTVQVAVPRGRLFTADGHEQERTSHFLARYQRRGRAVDGALLGAFLGGANSRRIKGALAPLLRAPVSKSAVSRIVGRLKALFETWRARSPRTGPPDILDRIHPPRGGSQCS